MQKIFLKYYDHIKGYYSFDNSQTCNFLLQDLMFFLRECNSKDIHWLQKYGGITWESIHLSTKNNNTVYLYNSDYIKQRANLQLKTIGEQDSFREAYSVYSKKRWHDMPILQMAVQNYEFLVQKWNEILQHKPNYIIISQDDTGYVDLVGKEELSEQDLTDMKIEHEKFLKYQAAWEKYEQAHPNRSEVWRSPADDEYEADWQKFLDEPLD